MAKCGTKNFESKNLCKNNFWTKTNLSPMKNLHQKISAKNFYVQKISCPENLMSEKFQCKKDFKYKKHLGLKLFIQVELDGYFN